MNDTNQIEENQITNEALNQIKLQKCKRVVKLDIIRTFAILCVMLCHALEGMQAFINGKGDYVALSIFHTIARLGVPMFLFLSGCLLLKKSLNSDEEVKEFYKKNLLPLIIVNYIWIVFYNIFFWFSGQREFVNAEKIIKELLFLNLVPVPNMWYLPMIIGMYLGIPFIAKIIKTFSLKTLKIMIIFLIISSFLIPGINELLSTAEIKQDLELTLDLHFLGGTYGVYIILGYYMYNANINNLDKKWLIICALVCFFAAAVKRFLLEGIWYNSLYLLLTSICVFILFNYIEEEKINEKLGKICTYISKRSLGLFFIHYIIQTVLYNFVVSIPIASATVKSIILFIGVTMLSVLVIKIVSKIKFISKHILLIK